MSLASVAPSVWHGATGRAAAHAHGANGTVLTELELSRAAQKAVALAQQEKSTWTRADVIKYLGRVLPRSGMNPAAAAALLEDLADRALRSEFEPVVCLEAPEPAEVPRSLLRADGRSVYQRHGGTRYATRAQLAMEERMLTQARASGAPRLTRAQAARALGADPAQLDDALTGRAPDAHAPRTQTGLREDQAAAALSVLTDGKRVSVINAPAGSGKTRVLTETGHAWAAAGLGPVVGITAAQSARNTLAAGVPVSYNSAQFLGHLPGRRGARGPVETGQRPLLLVDEASTMPGPDLADLIAYARARDGKLILAGDTSQLQAVENGGGMSLLAGALGYARLAEPARFRAAWEQAASLRLRDGDTTVLADYDQHGRIHGGDPEQMMDAAAAAYVALTADGTDTLLMAAEHALRRELSRRIRDDLIALGIVEPGPAVRIADGAHASPGDLITCTRNDHTLRSRTTRPHAGQRGPAAHRGRHRARAWSCAAPWTPTRPPGAAGGPTALSCTNISATPNWGTRSPIMSPMGRTVHTGLAVITGTEDRQHAYVALTRGTDANLAYVFTTSPKRADPVPGPRPAPELARYDQIHTERTGEPAPGTPPARARRGAGGAGRRPGPRRPAALGHPGPPAGPRRRRPPGPAARDLDRRNHPGPPAALPRPAHGRPARRTHRDEPGHQARWLFRTLRAAELAGLDPAQVLADAIGERDLAGSRDLAAVLDARIRSRLGAPVPLPAGPWSAQVPAIADPERRAYVTEIAALMDARKDRIGEHAAEHALPWAVAALGPVPDHPLDRLDWQKRAASIGAWRELSGYQHPTEPIGPEPAAAAPDLRAAWHEAFAALGPVDGPDVRGMPDGMLLHLRDTYPTETAWAPQYVGDELRQVRAAAWQARLAGLRAGAEATAAARRGQHDRATQQQDLADSYQALHQAYQQRETVFAAIMADRADWDIATRAQRHLAVAADAELRRRHPGQHYPPLRSAEPPPASAAQRAELTLTTDQPPRGDRPVDQRPRRRPPHVRRHARRTPKPRPPVRGSRLRRPRPGVPALARTGQRRHLAAAQTRDHARPRRSCSGPRTATPTRRPQRPALQRPWRPWMPTWPPGPRRPG